MLQASLHRLFEEMNYCPGGQEITLENQEDSLKITVHKQKRTTSPVYLPIYPTTLLNLNPYEKENLVTFQIFKKIILSFIPSEKHEEKKIIKKNIRNKIEGSLPLTAEFVRECYKNAIASNLLDYRKVAALADPKDRLIYSDHSFCIDNNKLHSKEEEIGVNKKTWKKLIEKLKKEWGEKRLKRACQRLKVDLSKAKEGLDLKKKDIENLMIGLSDYDERNLFTSLKKIQAIALNACGLNDLPLREKQALKKNLDLLLDEELEEKIAELFKPYHESDFENLPADLKELLENSVFLDNEELELSFQGHRLEGVIGGAQSCFLSQLKLNVASLDKERLHIYQTIMDAKFHLPKGQLEVFFDELLAKALSKKELYEGLMIPTPWSFEGARYYTVKARINTGKAKLAYFLSSTNIWLKDRLIFRGTSLDPSMTDSSSTLLVDLYPLKPPAYLWKNAGMEEEKKIYFLSRKIIRVFGHSLGACQTQLSLIAQTSDFPDREKIELVTFDSPKISRKCSQRFATWLNENSEFSNKISICHYINKADYFPKFGGGSLLGEKSSLPVEVYLLSYSKNLSLLAFKAIHTLMFFRTQDYNLEKIEIDEYLKNHSFLETIRQLGGAFLFPVLFASFLMKRFFFGWSGSPPLIKLLSLRFIRKLYFMIRRSSLDLKFGPWERIFYVLLFSGREKNRKII